MGNNISISSHILGGKDNFKIKLILVTPGILTVKRVKVKSSGQRFVRMWLWFKGLSVVSDQFDSCRAKVMLWDTC